ncbi:hypothetical protein QYF36_024856 [Acer negundo]|nr:hypothetical protein QYF36_024856 [Acer negundo]
MELASPYNLHPRKSQPSFRKEGSKDLDEEDDELSLSPSVLSCPNRESGEANKAEEAGLLQLQSFCPNKRARRDESRRAKTRKTPLNR